MSIQINYKKTIKNKANSNLIIFTDENFSEKSFKNKVSKNEFEFITDLLKTYNLTSNKNGDNNHIHMCDSVHLSPKCLSILFENHLHEP